VWSQIGFKLSVVPRLCLAAVCGICPLNAILVQRAKYLFRVARCAMAAWEADYSPVCFLKD
jgi:hypothetical protein